MPFWDSDVIFIRTLKAENTLFYGVSGFNFRINKEFVKHILYELSYKRYIPIPLDLHVKIIDHRKIAEKLTPHQIIRHLPFFDEHQIFNRKREKGEPQLWMAVHAPDRKSDGTIGRENRSVKIVYVHLVFPLITF